MGERYTITTASPDGALAARLVLAGEVRFGPSYYALAVGGRDFGQRMFGEPLLWSPSSQLLAVQEWLTLDYSAGPITALVLIDLAMGREATVAQATKGFVVPETFDGAALTYRIDYAAKVERHTLDVAGVAAWAALG
ncbi:hypothetical protein F8S13_18590 [Chloroflexia bacterium SDU3-3]|nr:hypothetical protein F8S13_18590 [Chloroflexia bacterium SDU3-3]